MIPSCTGRSSGTFRLENCNCVRIHTACRLRLTQKMEVVAHPTIELNRLKEGSSSAQHFYVLVLAGYGSKFGRADWETSTTTYMLWTETYIALLILFGGFSLVSGYPVVRRQDNPNWLAGTLRFIQPQ